jgi:radial spoke head protein 9
LFVYFICFIGLTAVESGKLSNYFHFREPIQLQQKSLIYRQTLDKSLHFLDTIDEDIPKGMILHFR